MPRRDTALADAAERVVAVHARYARGGVSLAQAALAGARTYEPLRHYPLHDVVDRDRRCQFYYHGHESSRVPDEEHGHFHLFVRPEAEPGVRFFHLAALSLDARGWPLRWFCTNRWVTGEDWVDAAVAARAIDGFRPQARGRLAPVADWLGAMVALHADAIARLLHERDAVVARHAARTTRHEFLEDRRQDVLCESPVSLARRLTQVGEALAA